MIHKKVLSLRDIENLGKASWGGCNWGSGLGLLSGFGFRAVEVQEALFPFVVGLLYGLRVVYCFPEIGLEVGLSLNPKTLNLHYNPYHLWRNPKFLEEP